MNRLREVNDTTGTVVRYLYDATNRRVMKDFPTTSTHVDTEYAYDGWQAVEEYEDGDADPTRQFVFGRYIDEPLVMDTNADGDATCYILGGTVDGADARHFYLQNAIYHVAGLTDADGHLVEGYEYDPYGRHWRFTDGPDNGDLVSFSGTDVRTEMAASSLGNPFTFTGRRFDPETGMHYYRMRYYDAQRGRFVSRDPIGLVGDINLYAYANHIPIRMVDSFGLKACYCGPDITNIWKKTEDYLWLYFRNRISTEQDLRFLQNKCLAAISIDGWEIEELRDGGFIDHSMYQLGCGTGLCNATVEYQGQCYHANEVNYILWGAGSRLCNIIFGLMKHRNMISERQAYTFSWDNVMEITGIYNLFRLRDQALMDRLVQWTKHGYGRGAPPKAHGKYKACKSCPVNLRNPPERFTRIRWGGAI